MWKHNMPEINRTKHVISDGDHMQINRETMD